MTTKVYCNKCGKEIEDYDWTTYNIGVMAIDLCPECLQKYHDLVRDWILVK